MGRGDSASVEHFVRSSTGGSPLAGLVARAPAPAYEELVREVERELGQSGREGSLRFPVEAHLAAASA
jgi:hypothetical protein